MRLPIAIALTLAACVPEPTPPSPRGVAERPPPTRPEPAPDPEPPPADPLGPWPVDPPPAPGIDPRPPGGAPGPHPLDPAPLPPAWPVGDAVAAVEFERVVVADERVVGYAAHGGALIAATGAGGLFRAGDLGGWRPQPTTLPPLRAFTGAADALLACPADGGPARFAADRALDPDGPGWARLDFACGAGGRRTVALDAGRAWVLDGETLRHGSLPGPLAPVALPVDAPRALGAAGGRVIVAGVRGVAVRAEAGRFAAGLRPDPAPVALPRDVALTGKGQAVIVGRGAPGRVGIEYSADGGLTWAPAEAPDRLSADLAAVAVDARGVFYATPREPGPALRSDDGGRTWRALALDRPVDGPLWPASTGALAGGPRALSTGLDRPAPEGPGLDRPLWRAVFTHPRVGVGVGVLGGLWRTVDGGARWFAVPGTGSLPFTDLDRVEGHAVVAVGEGLFHRSVDAGARWRARPPPGSCQARWVRFAGPRGLADCRDGRPVLSFDGGQHWERLEPDRTGEVPERGPAVRVDGSTGPLLATLAADGRVGWSRDGERFEWQPAPAPLVELARAPGAVSALAADGRLWRRVGPEAPWIAGPRPLLDGPATTHRPLLDGRILLATDGGLWVAGPDGAARALGPAPGVHAITLRGDGGVLVLHDGATTLFAPR